jgi:hypothetical protein
VEFEILADALAEEVLVSAPRDHSFDLGEEFEVEPSLDVLREHQGELDRGDDVRAAWQG